MSSEVTDTAGAVARVVSDVYEALGMAEPSVLLLLGAVALVVSGISRRSARSPRWSC